MNPFERVLIAGTGPAAIQLAVTMNQQGSCAVALAGRESAGSSILFATLAESRGTVRAETQNESHRRMQGECRLDRVYPRYADIDEPWDVLVLAVTTDAYCEVLEQMDSSVLRQLRCVILVSPTFGSGSLVSHYMRNRGHDQVEIISFSTYFGDTRWKEGTPSFQVLTAGIKKKVYVGSTAPASPNVARLTELFSRLGIQLQDAGTPLAAETRNISLYVHPPLFMNDVALEAVFHASAPRRYVYKLFPEGPITMRLIEEMLDYWKEIMDITERLSLPKLNLLACMNEDSYPVRPESLAREDIERFTELEPIHQQYLLYVRYASLLIDPFSDPDPEGKYFDFSAVPIRQTYVNKEGKLDIPRMPKEDYYRIKIIRGMARRLGAASPVMDRLIARYESALERAAAIHAPFPLSRAFAACSFDDHVDMICSDPMIRKNDGSAQSI